MSSPTLKMRTKNVLEKKNICSKWSFVIFLERESNFSLRFQKIRQSEFFGTRSKVVLRGEGNAWVPVLRSFDKIREVEVLSYLSFTLYLSVL